MNRDEIVDRLLSEYVKRRDEEMDRTAALGIAFEKAIGPHLDDLDEVTVDRDRLQAEVERYRKLEEKWTKELVQAGIDNDRLATIGNEAESLSREYPQCVRFLGRAPVTHCECLNCRFQRWAERWREARKQC